MADKIIIQSPLRKPPMKDLNGRVAIRPDAEIILRRLSDESGMSIRHLVSEIIVKASDLIEIEYRQ